MEEKTSQQKATDARKSVSYEYVGRHTVMTNEIVLKLEQSFALDATVEEACSYAKISRSAFYVWLEKNPEFKDRIDDLRQNPILAARKTVVDNLGSNPKIAFKYLERKKKDEFALKQEIEHSGNVGERVTEITMLVPKEYKDEQDTTTRADLKAVPSVQSD